MYVGRVTAAPGGADFLYCYLVLKPKKSIIICIGRQLEITNQKNILIGTNTYIGDDGCGTLWVLKPDPPNELMSHHRPKRSK